MARRTDTLVPGTYPRLLTLGAVSFVGSLCEAGLLVVMARIALAATDDTEHFEVLPGTGWRVTVATAILIALGFVIAKVAVGLVLARISSSTSTRALTVIRQTLLRSYLGASWHVQAVERQGELQDVMTTQADKAAKVVMTLSAFVTAALNVATFVVISIFANVFAAIVIVVAGASLAASLRPLSARGRRTSHRELAAGRTFASAISELVGTTRELRVFGTGPQALERMEGLNDHQAGLIRRTRFLTMLGPTLYQASALLLLICGIGLLTTVTRSSIAAIGAVMLLLLRALTYGQQTQSLFQALNELSPSLDHVSRRIELYQGSPVTSGDTPVASIRQLELEDVSFEYLPDRPVLRGVSGTIEAGEAIGIIGPSGSGKSTLLQILLRLREPTAGRFLANGVDTRDLAQADWYGRVAFVPQDPHLIEGTVAENIAFYRDMPLARVHEAAAMAHLAEEIEALPHGYDEIIGPEDTSLSGGQQQRLTIARALAGRPDLLVLDEPTSALDMRSEARLQDTLRSLRGRMTLLVVAHRLTTIAECDRIMVLANGAVQGFDRPEQLALSSDFYDEALRLSVLHQSPAGTA
ncbi:MAG TPA: ABC transporter ATP-binding protein [Acidimicrobiales bacterium]|nr:ABC transporter ATP-binding protein [Acidimicrobiales bacterium]